MTETTRLVMVYGNLNAAEPSITHAQLPAEEFPVAPHLTGIKAWTAMSLDGQRLVVLALEDLRDKAIERWKSLRVEVRQDSTRFGLLLKGRHVSH